MAKPMMLTVMATMSEACPPCSKRESTSLPLISVPSGWPGEPGGRELSSTLPPTGGGRGINKGRMKQAKNSAAIRPAGSPTTNLRRCLSHSVARPVVAVSEIAASGMTSVTAISNPRVQNRVHDVDNQVREHGYGGKDDDAHLHHGDVVGQRPIQQQHAHTRHRKDAFDDDGAAHQATDVEAHQGEQPEGGVAEGVPPQHRPGRDTLGPGGVDVVSGVELFHQVTA